MVPVDRTDSVGLPTVNRTGFDSPSASGGTFPAQTLPGRRDSKWAALEASRLARDPRDLTAAATAERAPSAFAYKGAVVRQHTSTRIVSADGLRFEYAGTISASRHAADLRGGPVRFDTLGRRISPGSGGGPGRGAAGWSLEKRKRISRKANAARWGK